MVSLRRTIRLGATATLMSALAFGAGCSTEHATAGGSPSDSAVTPPTSAATPTTVTALPPTTTAKRLDATLGPVGYDGIDLRMTVAQARDSGKIAEIMGTDDDFGCRRFTTRTGWVGYMNKGKVVSIIPKDAPHTPEGITAGSTLAEVRAAYPDLRFGVNWSSATVPGHPENRYGFMGIYSNDNGTGQAVDSLLLFAADTDVCHN
ncbi:MULTISPECIES: hypothetical protein [unclassified Nocardia]|uniref:hypothetical protein n=1 Tax=unclassified Nocardia TaxID=2637762 RepID=UPI001CE46F82|nr:MULTISPECIES: hypothetical protein [unclassified Nocardia]